MYNSIFEQIPLIMIKKAFPFFIFLFIFFIPLSFIAQKTSQFSGDTLKFPKELSDYFYENSANKKDAEVYMDNFAKQWKLPEMAGTYKKNMIETSNQFLKKRLKP